jgi:hypothetical protein
MGTSGVVDYSFALGVASALATLLMVFLSRIPALAVGQSAHDMATQALMFALSLLAVGYTAAAANQLDLRHALLEYVWIALGPAALHFAIKYNPPTSPAAASAGAADPATVASVTAQVQSGVATALAS